VIAIIFHYRTKVSFHYDKSAGVSNGHALQLVLHWSVDSLVVPLERHVTGQYEHFSIKAFLLTVYIPCNAEDFFVTVSSPLHFHRCIFQLWVAGISLLAEESWAGLVARAFNREWERSLTVRKLLPTHRVDALPSVLL